MELTKRFLFTWLTALTLVAGLTQSQAQASCKQTLKLIGSSTQAAVNVRELKEIKTMRVMAFNVNNLFTSEVERVGPKPPQVKSEFEIKRLRDIIQETNPDFAVFTEVASKASLDKISKGYPKTEYESYLIQGNDPRGINIGFAVKKDLPFHIEQISHKHVMWYDHITKKDVPLFSRDLPVLLFRTEANAKPFLILFGNHAKSQRNRKGDPLSSKWRTAQFKGAAKIVEQFKQKFGDVPMIFAGDHNTNVMHSNEIAPLWPHFVDSFNAAPDTLAPGPDRTTFTYHPLVRWRPKKEGVAIWNQLDAILFSKGFANSLKSAKIYRYKDALGNVLRLPESFKERGLNPSDHYPIFVDFFTDKLF
ncbi:MAG: hypothetical protein SGI74_04780 [Oligoflexia bacterium]|nr:hypothetical protein [Oligoflexia bacterium]